MYMTIGSGDIGDLLAGKNTKSHLSLFEKFISESPPHYNAIASPIDAFRAGAILEDRYYQILEDGYLPQVKAFNPSLDVIKVTIDFALIHKNKIVDFDELKSINLDDFFSLEKIKNKEYDEYIIYIKKYYKKYYNQVQSQLFATGLDEANLVFLVVYSYNDSDNYERIIQPNEFIKFRIKRDDIVISSIKERASIFQSIKNYYLK